MTVKESERVFRKLHNLQSFSKHRDKRGREGGGGGGHGCAVNSEQGEMQRCVAANTSAGEKPRLLSEKAMGERRFRGIRLSIEQLELRGAF